jgi:copper chaperone CopZ
MRSLIGFLSFALVCTSLAGDFTPYTATVTGVVCGSCKMHVTEALKKLPGVEKIEFSKGEKEDTQKVTFSSSSATLTKEDAVKALGADAQRYEVLALNKAK